MEFQTLKNIIIILNKFQTKHSYQTNSKHSQRLIENERIRTNH